MFDCSLHRCIPYISSRFQKFITTILDCRESVLETLTDISHEFYLKLTEQLRAAVDEEATTGTTGFPV